MFPDAAADQRSFYWDRIAVRAGRTHQPLRSLSHLDDLPSAVAEKVSLDHRADLYPLGRVVDRSELTLLMWTSFVVAREEAIRDLAHPSDSRTVAWASVLSPDARVWGLGLVLGLFCDFAGEADFLDDQVARIGFENALELRIMVAGQNKKTTRMLARPLLGVMVDVEAVGAPVVGALADEYRLGRGGPMAIFEACDVLVHLAEERLVAGGPLLPAPTPTTTR